MSAVTEYLATHDVDFFKFDHPKASTAREEARLLGLLPGAVAKTIVLDTEGGHAVAVIPASERLDLRRAAAATGDAHVRLATEEEIARDYPQFELGALPPIAELLDTDVYVDAELATHQTVVFASGTQSESVKMRTADLLTGERVTLAPLCRTPREFDQDWVI